MYRSPPSPYGSQTADNPHASTTDTFTHPLPTPPPPLPGSLLLRAALAPRTAALRRGRVGLAARRHVDDRPQLRLGAGHRLPQHHRHARRAPPLLAGACAVGQGRRSCLCVRACVRSCCSQAAQETIWQHMAKYGQVRLDHHSLAACSGVSCLGMSERAGAGSPAVGWMGRRWAGVGGCAGGTTAGGTAAGALWGSGGGIAAGACCCAAWSAVVRHPVMICRG